VYLRVASENSVAQLLEKESFKQFSQKQGAYGTYSALSAVDNFSSWIERTSYNLTVREELTLVKYKQYAIADKKGSIIFPDRKKLIKMFSRHKAEINDYLNKNSVQYENQESLVRLMNFLEGLK
jgi:hypothetical protein